MTLPKPKPPVPAFCPFIYHDGQAIYLEYANHVERLPYTEAGLWRAIHRGLIPNIGRSPGYLSGNSNIAHKVLPKLARTTKIKREIANFTTAQRDAATAVIRKLKTGE